jgi:endonuclease/exonuclease/phosphatase family metal-dependent hydrolase
MRLITWNCHHGSLAARLADLATHSPDIVFVQECRPGDVLPFTGPSVCRTINPKKGIALASMNSDYHLEEVSLGRSKKRAAVAVRFSGPLDFVALGIWAHGPDYVQDVLKSVNAHRKLLRASPAIVMGDLNSGPRLHGTREVSKSHARLLDAMSALGLVSAYHAFHGIEHGEERHPTYHHQRRSSAPWHIDFCFIPAAWRDRLLDVEIMDGDSWRAISDHLPLRVDLRV